MSPSPREPPVLSLFMSSRPVWQKPRTRSDP